MPPKFWLVMHYVALIWVGLFGVAVCRTCLADEPGKLSIPPTEATAEASSPGSLWPQLFDRWMREAIGPEAPL